MREILMSDVVIGAFATLVALLLGVLTELVRRQLRKVGLEVEQKEQQIIKAKVEEGVLFARQLERGKPDGASRNNSMRQIAKAHVVRTGGKAVKALASEDLDDLVEIGVRRLKRLL